MPIFSKPSSAIILPIVSSNRFSVASRSLSPVMLFPFILRIVTIREQMYVTYRKHANNMLGKFAVVESFLLSSQCWTYYAVLRQFRKRLLILLSFAGENRINMFYKPFKIKSMEVVTIEKRTFLYVCERFTEFAKRIESLYSTHTQKVENWLDSQEVCLLLGFSKRTLQYYRSSGRLVYSQIGSKIYYKSADIEKIISNCEIKNQSPKQITSYEKS